MAPVFGHRGIYAKIWNTANAVLYAPYLHYTNLPASSNLTLPYWQALLDYADLCNAKNTRKNRPIAASYLFPALPARRSKGRLYLPSLSLQLTEIPHYLSAYSCLPPAAPAEARFLLSAHNHMFHNAQLELVRPNNAVLKIPSLLIYNLSLLCQFAFLPKTQSFFSGRP